MFNKLWILSFVIEWVKDSHSLDLLRFDRVPQSTSTSLRQSSLTSVDFRRGTNLLGEDSIKWVYRQPFYRVKSCFRLPGSRSGVPTDPKEYCTVYRKGSRSLGSLSRSFFDVTENTGAEVSTYGDEGIGEIKDK